MSIVLAFVDDLMFMSRIREAARHSGAEVRPVRSVEGLREGAHRGARLVLVDADGDRLPWAEAVSSLGDDAGRSQLSVVAFVSHVAADRAEAARVAGCDRVLARGAFVRELPALIAAATPAAPEETAP